MLLGTRPRGRRTTGAVAAVLASALLLTTAATSSATGPDDSSVPPAPTDPTGPRDPAEAAERTLARAEQLVSDAGSEAGAPSPERVDLTLALRDLRLSLRHLDAGDRELARELLARPTDRDDEFAYARPRRAKNTCRVAPVPDADVCVYWEPEDSVHSPDPTDSDGDGVPDYVETVRDELQLVWDRIVTQGGYRAPLPDERGFDERLDVYLADIGGDGLYGFCAAEKLVEGLTAHGYCMLDDDYSTEQYPSGAPLDNLRVTAAHEFFHAVQFAYDSAEDPWLMEGTAVWVEDEIHDGIDDNRQFMVGGTLTHPRVALDAAGRKQSDFYHSWTWWRFLAELVPDQQGSGMPVIIRDVWERVDATDRDADVDSLRATVAAVRAVGRGFAATVAAYGEAKRHPADAFEEGASWPTVPLIDTYRVRAGSRTAWKSAALPHLTSQTFSFRPGSGTADPRWRLRIPVDAPSRVTGSHAQVTEVHADGHRVVRRIPLDRRGVGRIVTPFSSTVVSRIELTITNASTRYSCWHGSYLACRGRPLDDGRRTSFRGVTVKR